MSTAQLQVHQGGRARSEHGKVPPHDLDAEGNLLGTMLFDPARFAEVAALGLEPKHFYSNPNREIWRAALDLDRAGKSVELTSIASELRDRQLIQKCGGTKYLGVLAGNTPAVDVTQAATRILDLWRVREAMEAMGRARSSALLYNWGPSGPQGWLEKVTHTLDGLLRSNVQHRTHGIEGVMRAAVNKLLGSTAAVKGVPTYLRKLDRVTHGMSRREATLLLAAPKAGKSALCGQLAMTTAATPDDDGEHRNGVLYIALEMEREELGVRWMANVAKVDFERLWYDEDEEGEPIVLTEDEQARAMQAAESLRSYPLRIDDRGNTSPVSIHQVRDIARKAKSDFELQGKRLALVVLDLVQLLDVREHENTYRGLEKAGQMLRQLPRELDCHWLVVSHTNEKGRSRECPILDGHLQNVWRLKRLEGEPSASGALPMMITVERQRHGRWPVDVPIWGHREVLRFSEEDWLR